MIRASTLRAMVEAGCTTDQLLQVAEAEERRHDELMADRRERNRQAQRECRERKAQQNQQPCHSDRSDNDDTPSLDKEKSPLTPLKKLIPTPSKKVSEKETSKMPRDDFSVFWSAYPRKVAKGTARRAFTTASKKVSIAELVDGATRYSELVSDQDPKFVAHPATWLNGERWADAEETGGDRLTPQEAERKAFFDKVDAGIERMESNEQCSAYQPLQINDRANVIQLSRPEDEDAGSLFGGPITIDG